MSFRNEMYPWNSSRLPANYSRYRMTGYSLTFER